MSKFESYRIGDVSCYFPGQIRTSRDTVHPGMDIAEIAPLPGGGTTVNPFESLVATDVDNRTIIAPERIQNGGMETVFQVDDEGEVVYYEIALKAKTPPEVERFINRVLRDNPDEGEENAAFISFFSARCLVKPREILMLSGDTTIAQIAPIDDANLRCNLTDFPFNKGSFWNVVKGDKKPYLFEYNFGGFKFLNGTLRLASGVVLNIDSFSELDERVKERLENGLLKQEELEDIIKVYTRFLED